jgi:hypothetical protein
MNDLTQTAVKARLREMESYFASVASSPDTRNGHVSALLGLAVVNLDRTSTKLAIANIILGIALLTAAVVQIYLALCHP